jgi:serine/threonine protein kinase
MIGDDRTRGVTPDPDELDSEATIRGDAMPSTPGKETLPSGVTVQQLQGRTLMGRFELHEILGRGGMGIVYRAHDTVLRRDVALKVLPDEMKGDPQSIEDLKDEVGISQQLSHPHIVRLHDFHESDGLYFLTMELINGPTLIKTLAERRAPMLLEEVQEIVRQMCDGLEYAHGLGVIHRDLKPHNLMIEAGRNELKICDFGVAKILRDTASRVTQRGAAGTPAYMPPEQYEGRKIDIRADIYAAGATVYHLLFGRPPFHSGDIFYQLLNRMPDPIENIPDHINDALLRSMAKSADDRFPNIREFGAAFAGGATVSTSGMNADTLKVLAQGYRGTGPIKDLSYESVANAEQALKQVVAQRSEDRDAAALLSELSEEKTRRDSLASLIETIENARGDSRWPDVVEACEQLMSADPTNGSAVTWLSDARIRLRELEKEESRQRSLLGTARATTEALEAGDFDAATKAVSELALLDPTDHRVAQFEGRLDELRRYQEAMAAFSRADIMTVNLLLTEWPTPPADPSRLAELKMTLADWIEARKNRALAEEEAGNYRDACTVWEQILTAVPGDSDALAHHQLCVGARTGTLRDEAQACTDAADWEQAISAWTRYLEEFPDDVEAIVSRDEAIQLHDSSERAAMLRAKASRFMQKKDWSRAVKVWNELISGFPGDPAAETERFRAVTMMEVRGRKRRRTMIFLVLLLIVGGAAGGSYYWQVEQKKRIETLSADVETALSREDMTTAKQLVTVLRQVSEPAAQRFTVRIAATQKRTGSIKSLETLFAAEISSGDILGADSVVIAMKSLDPQRAQDLTAQATKARARKVSTLATQVDKAIMDGRWPAAQKLVGELKALDSTRAKGFEGGISQALSATRAPSASRAQLTVERVYKVYGDKAKRVLAKIRAIPMSSWLLSLKTGSRIQIKRYAAKSGMDAWTSSRDEYEGVKTTITSFGVGSSSEQPFVRVAADNGSYRWYLAALAKPGTVSASSSKTAIRTIRRVYSVDSGTARKVYSRLSKMTAYTWKLGLRKGSRVRLGRHGTGHGMDGWVSGRDQYVGSTGKITAFGVGASSGQPYVKVDADNEYYTWYIEALKRP